MDNFNLQKFVKKSKNEFYTNLYEGKKKHSMEEEMHDDDHKMEEKMHDDDHKMEEKMHDKDHKMEENHQSLDPEVADRIEGLLNISMKAKFLSAGVNLINDFLEDEVMDVEDVVSHLANELEKHYKAFATPPTSAMMEEDELTIDESYADSNFLKKLRIDDDAMEMVKKMRAAIESGKVKEEDLGTIEGIGDAIKKMVVDGAESFLKEADAEVDVEDEIPAMDLDLDMSTDEPDNKEVFSQLVDAYEAAKELGDEKLTRQLANTITYFNKTIIFGDEG